MPDGVRAARMRIKTRHEICRIPVEPDEDVPHGGTHVLLFPRPPASRFKALVPPDLITVYAKATVTKYQKGECSNE